MTLQPKLQEAAGRMRIVDVVLKAINASLSDDFDSSALSDEDAVSFQMRFPVCKSIKSYLAEVSGGRRRTVFEMDSGLRILRPAEEDHSKLPANEIEGLVCATVECRFLVSFDEMPYEGAYVDDDALALFASHNVPFNMWPYWREIVQSACGRMGLPRVVLPTHRLRKSATQSGASPESAGARVHSVSNDGSQS